MEKLCLGGSFNPIHHGHLLCAPAAAEAVGAKTVVLIPTGQAPHKTVDAQMAPAADRLAMCRLAISGTSGFEVDDREIIRGGPSFTIDTARELSRLGWGKVTWLIGADMLNALPAWHKAEELIQEVGFVVMARPGVAIAWERLPGAFGKLRECVVQVPQIDISATEIRQRVRKGKLIEFLCPEGVCGYIRERKLYL